MDEPTNPHSGPSGDPRIRALADAHAAEQAALDETIAVTSAERTVSSARIQQLADEQDAAYRRVSAARGQLTLAQKDGSAPEIATARARLAEREEEADRVGRTNRQQMRAIVDAQFDGVGQVQAQMSRTWAAGDQLTEALNEPPRGEQ